LTTIRFLPGYGAATTATVDDASDPGPVEGAAGSYVPADGRVVPPACIENCAAPELRIVVCPPGGAVTDADVQFIAVTIRPAELAGLASPVGLAGEPAWRTVPAVTALAPVYAAANPRSVADADRVIAAPV